jgi:V/A-type H+-transporting ATPase subunit K
MGAFLMNFGRFLTKNCGKVGKISKFLGVLCALFLVTAPIVALADTPSNAAATTADASGFGSGLSAIAAGLSIGLGSIGSGIAVAASASSALGAISEDPKIMGKAMIFVALAEGVMIFGFIIAIIILGK